MGESPVSKYLAGIGRKGGKARLHTMTEDERRAVARKAGKASGRARRKKAKKKKP
jgi:hypothetical protein